MLAAFQFYHKIMKKLHWAELHKDNDAAPVSMTPRWTCMASCRASPQDHCVLHGHPCYGTINLLSSRLPCAGSGAQKIYIRPKNPPTALLL